MINGSRKPRTINIYKDDEDEKMSKKDRLVMRVSADYIQVYNDYWRYVMCLNSVHSVQFLNWMVFNAMDDNNVADVSQESKRLYVAHLEKLNSWIVPSIRTVARGIRELVRARILIKTGRAKYMVNPVVMWKSSLHLRQKTISMFAEAKINLHPPKRNELIEDKENDIEEGATGAEELTDGTSGS